MEVQLEKFDVAQETLEVRVMDKVSDKARNKA